MTGEGKEFGQVAAAIRWQRHYRTRARAAQAEMLRSRVILERTKKRLDGALATVTQLKKLIASLQKENDKLRTQNK